MNSYLPAVINIAAFVIGQMLVTRRHWTGFLVWAAANYLVAITCLTHDNESTGCMFMVYCAANVYSMWLWSRHEEQETSILG
jgi:nicotinamide riboside transporter PnuC